MWDGEELCGTHGTQGIWTVTLGWNRSFYEVTLTGKASCASPVGTGGVEYSYGGSLFPQPGYLAWLRTSTGICDGRIKEFTVGKGGPG